MTCGEPRAHTHRISYASPQNQSHHFEMNVFTSTAWPLYQRSVCIKLYNQPNGKRFVKILYLDACARLGNKRMHTQMLSLASFSVQSYKRIRLKSKNKNCAWCKVKNTHRSPNKNTNESIHKKTWMKNYQQIAIGLAIFIRWPFGRAVNVFVFCRFWVTVNNYQWIYEKSSAITI